MLNATMGHSGTQSAAEAFCTVNAHCLENIVRLSDDMEVLASHDIVDDRGIKLWAKGKPVSRALQEKNAQAPAAKTARNQPRRR